MVAWDGDINIDWVTGRGVLVNGCWVEVWGFIVGNCGVFGKVTGDGVIEKGVFGVV